MECAGVDIASGIANFVCELFFQMIGSIIGKCQGKNGCRGSALGLDEIDHRLLDSIIDKFSGGPVGLDTLAASIGEDADTIMDIYEPYLLQLGFLDRTPRGRQATARAYEYLGKEPKGKDSQQQRLI